MKIRPVGAELFNAERRTDGQTETTKIIVAFRHYKTRLNRKTDPVEGHVGG
jgi:hypothetical protein